MAPEQGIGAPEPALDVYALGVVLFELLTGHPPFEGEPLDVILEKSQTAAPRIETLAHGIPLALGEWMASCLAIDPALRPRSASILADRLDEIVAAIGREPDAAVPGWAALARSHSASLMALGGFVATLAAFGLTRAEPAAQPASIATSVVELDERPVAPEPRAAIVRERVAVPQPPPAPPPARRSTARAAPRPPARALAPADIAVASEPDACARTRRRATDARAAHDWATVLRMTDERSCWASRSDRGRLRVQALMESGRFRECAVLGASLPDDDTVARWVRLCVARDRRGA
jgi:serine/threonine-protein kinase